MPGYHYGQAASDGVSKATRIYWEAFRAGLKGIHEKTRKSNAGAKPIDVALMFKVLVLQQLNNLSDDRMPDT